MSLQPPLHERDQVFNRRKCNDVAHIDAELILAGHDDLHAVEAIDAGLNEARIGEKVFDRKPSGFGQDREDFGIDVGGMAYLLSTTPLSAINAGDFITIVTFRKIIGEPN